MLINGDLSELMEQLDALREEKGLSYQDVADACGVSKATVYRALKNRTEPTAALVQNIIAVVQYVPPQELAELKEYTHDGYVDYLQKSLVQERTDTSRRIKQIQAHYNMLLKRNYRAMLVLSIILGAFVLFLCSLILYDFTHLDRGWIQAILNLYCW